jgi:transposase
MLRTILKSARLSWKKCKKLLRKADPEQRAAFVEQFQLLYREMLSGEVDVLYVDESHFHQDMDLGYTWAPTGEIAWRTSISPSLSARINWYGAYDFTAGQVLLWHEGNCNGENTAQFLQRIADWKSPTRRRLVIIWDGASWHRSQLVQAQAKKLDLELFPLSAYSPDLNPIEQLWKWMRAEVTQNFCHDTLHHLFAACHAFIASINQDPLAMIKRLWPKFELDPEYEKLLVSH